MMKPEDYDRLRELYHQLASLPPEEREREIAKHDLSPELRAELEFFLHDAPTATAFKDDNLGDVAPEILGQDFGSAQEEATPSRIANYRIEEELGRGGMGVVYKGVQEAPHREVAIKVLRSVATTKARLRRFEYEAEILARLDHPNVAKIFEAGLDPSTGRPYIAMEFVKGRDLQTHCDENELDIDDKLELFLRVCDGVEHAHQHGIVHRDLKPQNILVSQEGRPRILDFGIARPSAKTEEDADITPGQTQEGNVLGSLAWMSPEQARGDVKAIDVRSDVYSLGMIFYRVLSGDMPYVIGKVSAWEAAHIIDEKEPKRLGHLLPELRGDLEAIAAKALEKDPATRYASAGAMAADIRRFRSFQPVEARGFSTSYQLRKFARRHRGIVFSASIALLSLIAGTIFATAGFVKARTELSRANDIRQVLQSMLTSVRPEVARFTDTTLLKRLLDQTADRLDRGEVKDAQSEGELRSMIGSTYLRIDEQERGCLHLERAAELLSATLGDHDELTVRAEIELAAGYLNLDRMDDARRLFMSILDRPEIQERQRLLARVHHAAWMGRNDRMDEAIEAATKVLEEQNRILPWDHADILSTLGELGIYYMDQERLEEAEQVHLELLERMQTLSRDHPTKLHANRRLMLIYRGQGRFDDALALTLETHTLSQRVFGPRHDVTENTRVSVIDLYIQLGRAEEALSFALAELPQSRRPDGTVDSRLAVSLFTLCRQLSYPEDVIPTVIDEFDRIRASSEVDADEAYSAGISLGQLYSDLGQREKAIPLLEELTATARVQEGLNRIETLAVMNSLAVEYTQDFRIQEARELLHEVIKESERSEIADEPRTLFKHSLAETYLASRDYEEASQRLEDVLSDYLELDSSYTELTFQQLHDAYLSQQRRELAQETFARWIDWKRGVLGKEGTGPETFSQSAALMLDCPYDSVRDVEEAYEWAQTACSMNDDPPPMHIATLARCMAALGEAKEGLAILQDAIDGMPEDAPPALRQAMMATLAEIRGRL